jgi:flagellar biosynthesis GTPase FlhF
MSETKTYRGRSLEEVLPKIRAELGPDALVLKRREGLAGGLGGFFQHPYIEVEARAPVAEPEVEVRSDRATAEGLATPAMQELLAQASPFAARLAEATRHDGLELYGPQPAVDPAIEALVAADVWRAPDEPEPAPAFVPERLEAPSAPVAAGVAALAEAVPAPALAVTCADLTPAAPAAAEPALAASAVTCADLTPAAPAAAAPPQAAALRDALVGAGLASAFAAEAVDDAVRHGIPFASPRAIKGLVRAAVARRIPVMAPVGPGPRVVAVVGASGAGKTTAAARLAAAYRGAGTVAVRELTPDAAELRQPFDGLTVVDAPATGVRDADGVRALARRLRGLKAEVHLAVPATMSAAAAADLAGALAPLKPTHLLLTHADETSHPGAVVAHAIAASLPLSYVSGATALVPADAADLAKRLCG